MADPTLATSRRAHRARRAKPRPRISVLGVIGELLLTAGVVVLLYVSWQLWIGDVIIGSQRNDEGLALSEQWAQAPVEDPAIASPSPDATGEPSPDATEEPPADPAIPVLAEAGDAEKFGVMYVPRFGPDYAVPMAGGVTRSGTLDHIGIGHYPGTPMPGDVGNVALAAHRTTYGKPFADIANLRLNDAIVIETQEGWYTYRFRTLEYVQPDEVSVLADVPQQPDMPADGGRYLTMTSCSPKFSLAERIVAYNVFESFTPRTDGPPAALTEGI